MKKSLQRYEKEESLGYKNKKKMRKVKILIASVLFCAMVYAAYVSYNQMIDSRTERFMKFNTEALTLDETGSEGAYIECRCTSTISTTPNGCYADGKSSTVCHGGINAKCWEYHLNCKKTGI